MTKPARRKRPGGTGPAKPGLKNRGLKNRSGGMRKGPPPPRGSGIDGPFRGLLCARLLSGRPGQLAAGAGLDGAEEPVPDAGAAEVVVDDVDDDPEPTELLEEERLSVR